MRPLLPHQVPACLYGDTRNTAAFLLDKRLGKCTVAIRWALGKGARRILVVAPLSACPGWLDELEADGQAGVFLYGAREERTRILLESWNRIGKDWQVAGGQKPSTEQVPLFYVTNSHGVFTAGRGGPPVLSDIAQVPYDAVILDESRCIFNPKSQTNKAINAAFGHVKYRAILTGEVAPEGPQDIFEQMKWCHGSFMGHTNFWRWRQEFFQQVGYEWLPKPKALTQIRETLHREAFVLSRKDAGLGEVKSFEKRYCEMSPHLWAKYRQIAKEFFCDGWETKYAVVVATQLSRITGGFPTPTVSSGEHHKLNLLAELVTGEYANEPLVVLFRYNAELYAARDFLQKRGVSVGMIDGSVPPDRRRRWRVKFFRGEIRVLLMQSKVAKFGIDLSHADTMIRYSMPYDYDTISQSMDRIIHPKKKMPLHYVDLITKGTVDEDLVDTIFEKRISSRIFMENLAARINRRFTEAGILAGS